jgi:hypothetical protein
MIWRRAYGPDARSPQQQTWRTSGVLEWFERPWLTHHAVTMLRRWTRLLDAVRQPWPARSRASAAFREEQASHVREQPRFQVFARWMMPASFSFIDYLVVPSAAPLTLDRCARASLAVERYRREHAGQLPKDLEALVPAYLASVPVDPFTGQSLRFGNTATAYTIYGAGDDGRDDGGDLSSEQAQVTGGRRVVTRGRDVGIRVWFR